MTLQPRPPPGEVCILRLSAVGDVCHVLPVVRTLQAAWPKTRFTWIIGKTEARLLGDIPEIEFITFDKKAGAAAFKTLRQRLHGRRFDMLLQLQLSLRASLVSRMVRASVRLGFDKPRSRELQWLFTNRQIAPNDRVHVMDVLFGFAEALGVSDRRLVWDIPLSDDDKAYAQRLITGEAKTLVISPCSSHNLRNWRAEYYAAVADHAVRTYAMRVILTGGTTKIERQMADAILLTMHEPAVDTVGKSSLKELLALLARADLLISPDSGPVHMATAVRTPVLGLYAASSSARAGPYFSLQWCLDEFDAAARKYLGKPAAALRWGAKIERPGVMDLIEPARVIAKLDEFMTAPSEK